MFHKTHNQKQIQYISLLNKRILMILFFALCLSATSQAQYWDGDEEEEEVVKLDTIVRLGGKKMVVDVIKVDETFITYKDPNVGEIERMDRKNVQDIIYYGGKIERLNKPILEMLDETDWETVLLVESAKDVKGLYERGKVDAISPPSSRSAKAAKTAAEIKIKKKAANMKAMIILVTHRETRGGYGEMPGYYIEGVAYGTDPIDESSKKPTP
jgi:hypothetical protein